MKRRMLKVAAAVAAVTLLLCYATAEPAVSARSAIVMDAQTGRALWEHQADTKSLIASTTKIMTGLLISEECDLQSEVAVSEKAVGIEGSSIYLEPGEVLTVEALLYGMMLHSGNDAAVALALYCGGTVENFVEKMNNKAVELGLKDTRFANPHGLDSKDNFSTARDLAKLAAYAMDDSVFSKVVCTKTVTFGSRTFTNHNKLLWRYKGAVGVKTGYTMSAGRILVSCAERDGRRLIAVTISDPNDWHDHSVLLDYGFAAYTVKSVAKVDDAGVFVPVIGGSENVARAVLLENFEYPVAETEIVELQYLVPEFVYPPIIAGALAGELRVLVDGNEIARLPLYWEYSVLEGAQ